MRILFLFIVVIVCIETGYSQMTRKVDIIDSTFNAEGRKKMFSIKNITASSMTFFFFNKQSNDIFRISTYKNKRDTIFNYLYAGNYFRVDIGIKKKYAIYYFENGELVGSKEVNLSVQIPYLYKQNGDSLRQEAIHFKRP